MQEDVDVGAAAEARAIPEALVFGCCFCVELSSWSCCCELLRVAPMPRACCLIRLAGWCERERERETEARKMQLQRFPAPDFESRIASQAFRLALQRPRRAAVAMSIVARVLLRVVVSLFCVALLACSAAEFAQSRRS